MKDLMFSDRVLYNSLINMGIGANATVILEEIDTCFYPDYAYVINDSAEPFAQAVIILVTIALIVMNLFVCCTGKETCSLVLFYMASCIFVGMIFAFAMFHIMFNPYMDTIYYVRAVFLFFLVFWSCFICSCIYVTTVTAKLYTTQYYNNGNSSTTTTDIGYVECQTWGFKENKQ